MNKRRKEEWMYCAGNFFVFILVGLTIAAMFYAASLASNPNDGCPPGMIDYDYLNKLNNMPRRP